MFYLIEIPFLTTDLLANETLVKSAKTFYSKKEILNEDYGEMWIHRGLKRMTEAQGHTKDPSKADVFWTLSYSEISVRVFGSVGRCVVHQIGACHR